jgi:hypothetical protein
LLPGQHSYVNVDIEDEHAPSIGDIIADPVYNSVTRNVIGPDPQEANASARMWASTGDMERKAEVGDSMADLLCRPLDAQGIKLVKSIP